MALMGVPVALTVGIGVGFLNFFTLWLLVVLFLERKQYMVSSACAMLRMPGLCCMLLQSSGRRGNAAQLKWSYRMLGTS